MKCDKRRMIRDATLLALKTEKEHDGAKEGEQSKEAEREKESRFIPLASRREGSLQIP